MPIAVTMLSPHFTLAEFTYSQTAARMGLPNQPGPTELANLQRLARIMEQVRLYCGSNPVTITSGYRSPPVNAACGGSSTSAHMSGLAADFIIPAHGDPHTVCKTIEPRMKELGIDQLIYEYGDWVHLGLAAEGMEARCQCLTIDSSGTHHGIA